MLFGQGFARSGVELVSFHWQVFDLRITEGRLADVLLRLSCSLVFSDCLPPAVAQPLARRVPILCELSPIAVIYAIALRFLLLFDVLFTTFTTFYYVT